MNGTDRIVVGRPLPRIASVMPEARPGCVRITWAEGTRAGLTETVDVTPTIATFRVFRPLRDDPALFAMVRLGEDGASIVWDGNDDLDIGADALEAMAEEAMKPADFAAFMKRHGLSLDATAAQLGISRRLAAYYARDRPIPRHIALACRYLDAAARAA